MNYQGAYVHVQIHEQHWYHNYFKMSLKFWAIYIDYTPTNIFTLIIA